MTINREAAAKRALEHLAKYGDTDLFPTLPEMRCYTDKSDEVAAAYAGLTVGNYKPRTCVETLTPKGALGFRISHQLDASDSIVYLASTILAAPKLDADRQPKENHRSFAYRFHEAEDARLFHLGRSYHDWMNHITKFGTFISASIFTASRTFSVIANVMAARLE